VQRLDTIVFEIIKIRTACAGESAGDLSPCRPASSPLIGPFTFDKQDYKLRAKQMAFFKPSILPEKSLVIKGPTLFFETVWMWSQLKARSMGIPSLLDRKTSLCISRMVDVTGAIVTSPKESMIESLVSITTGRFLSGG